MPAQSYSLEYSEIYTKRLRRERKMGQKGTEVKRGKKMSVRNRSEWKYFKNDRAGGTGMENGHN